MHANPVALITGANKGIGLQIAKDLAAHGLTVVVGSRNLEQADRSQRHRRRRPRRPTRCHRPGFHRCRSTSGSAPSSGDWMCS